jgi:hypothetical protein
MHLGSELQPVLDQLRRVYPRGVVPDADYWALLVILQEDMSVEALSKVVAELIDDELVVIENHAAEATSRRRPATEDVERVRGKLRDGGWEPEEP